MKHSSMKRFLALLLCAMLVGGMFTTAWADPGDAEPEEPAEETESQGMIQPVTVEEPQDEDELPVIPVKAEEYLWLGETAVTAGNADSPLSDGSARFDPSTNTLTFTKAPTITGLHDGAIIDAPNLETLTIVTPASGLSLSSKTAARGISVGSGAITVNGDLRLSLSSSSAEAGIYVINGLTVNGNLAPELSAGAKAYGVKSISGPVTVNGDAELFDKHTGIYSGNGDIKVGGAVFAMIDSNEMGGLSPSAVAYAANGTVELGSLEATMGKSPYKIYATGTITVNGTVKITDESAFHQGLYSTDGGIVIGGTANINTTADCLYAGGSDGITINANATLTSSTSAVNTAKAAEGPVTVKGNLTISGYGDPALYAKGDITVEGNAQVTSKTYSSNERRNKGIVSETGSVGVTGKLTCTGCTSDGVYARNDITVGGDVTVGTSIVSENDYILKAETGELNIGGSLTTTGLAPSSAFGATGLTVGKNVTITNAAEDAIGLYSNGTVTMRSGEWDITAKQAILAKGGIEIPETHSIILPAGGVVSQLDGGSTITEEDGTTIPDHVIISDAEFVFVTFDLNYEGSEAILVPVHKGTTLSKIPALTGHGEAPMRWVPVGWYTEKAEGLQVGKVGDKITLKMIFDEDTTVFAQWRLLGDINGDGTVTNKDVTRLIRFLKSGDVEVVEAALDTNGDGNRSNKDVTRLIRYIKSGDVEIY